MSRRIHALRNVGTSWLGLATNFLVGFFLSPFILHRIGDDAFGLWVLVFALTGYYGLFDFGIRSSIIRYVAQYQATGDSDRLNCFINTSLLSYGAIGLLLLTVTIAGSFYVDSIFRIPASLHATAKIVFLIVGATVSLGFPLGVFGGALEGLQKFNWLSLTQVSCNLVRTLLIVVALTHGGRLLAIALITVVLNTSAYLVYFAVVRRMISLRLGWEYIDRESFQHMASFGSITFIAIIAFQLRFYSDATVIGIFIGSAAITYFSIGSKLVSYSSNVTQSMSQIFTPMSSEFNATGDTERLRRVFIMGNRACALLVFPICAALLILGRSVIEVWVGAKYVPIGYAVLAWFAIGDCTEMAQSASPKVLYGMARHRTMALVRLTEGVVNLILSIVLLRRYGVVGVAIGTVVPQLCTNLLFMPEHLCRILGVRLRTFLTDAYLAPLLLTLPMAALLLVMQRFLHPRNYLELLAQVLAGVAVYGAGVLWFLLTREQMGVQLRAKFREYRQYATGAVNLMTGAA
ncbi:MAG TPA: oligosaccharide flippase family protein [Terriglobales bacterium]